MRLFTYYHYCKN